jgi:voltage-gated potassium channel
MVPEPGYSPRQQETWKPWDAEEKKQLAAKVDQNAELMRYCLQTARKKFVDNGLVENEDSVCSLASVLFSHATGQ